MWGRCSLNRHTVLEEVSKVEPALILIMFLLNANLSFYLQIRSNSRFSNEMFNFVSTLQRESRIIIQCVDSNSNLNPKPHTSALDEDGLVQFFVFFPITFATLPSELQRVHLHNSSEANMEIVGVHSLPNISIYRPPTIAMQINLNDIVRSARVANPLSKSG